MTRRSHPRSHSRSHSWIASLLAIAFAGAITVLAAPVYAQTPATPPPAAADASAAAPAAPGSFKAVHFFVQVQGAGPDVILIPGLGCSRDVWKEEAALLAPHYRLHLVQIRGFAGYPAGANASGPLMKPIEAELAQYIESNNLKQPAIIGHSLGGTLALMLAARHPQDVGKLLIVDALPFIGVLFNPKATVAESQGMAEGMRDEILDEPATNFLHGENLQIAGMVKTPSKRAQVVFWAVNSDRHTLTNALVDDFSVDLRPDMPKIQTPMTVLYPFDRDTQSQKDTDSLYHQAYATAPHATLLRIDESSHFIMLDQPQKFDEQVQKFLKS